MHTITVFFFNVGTHFFDFQKRAGEFSPHSGDILGNLRVRISDPQKKIGRIGGGGGCTCPCPQVKSFYFPKMSFNLQNCPFIFQNYRFIFQKCFFASSNCPSIFQKCPLVSQKCLFISQKCLIVFQNCPWVFQNCLLFISCAPSFLFFQLI